MSDDPIKSFVEKLSVMVDAEDSNYTYRTAFAQYRDMFDHLIVRICRDSFPPPLILQADSEANGLEISVFNLYMPNDMNVITRYVFMSSHTTLRCKRYIQGVSKDFYFYPASHKNMTSEIIDVMKCKDDPAKWNYILAARRRRMMK